MTLPRYPWNTWLIIAVLTGMMLFAGAIGYLARN